MDDGKRKMFRGKGRFLSGTPQERQIGRTLLILVLLTWDGLLLYMIVECLIEPVYGGAFVALISIYLGYQF